MANGSKVMGQCETVLRPFRIFSNKTFSPAPIPPYFFTDESKVRDTRRPLHIKRREIIRLFPLDL